MWIFNWRVFQDLPLSKNKKGSSEQPVIAGMCTRVLPELSPFSAWFQVNNLRVTFKFFKEVHLSYLIISFLVKEFLKGHPVLKLSLCTLLPFQCLYPNVFSCSFLIQPIPKMLGVPLLCFLLLHGRCVLMNPVLWLLEMGPGSSC